MDAKISNSNVYHLSNLNTSSLLSTLYPSTFKSSLISGNLAVRSSQADPYTSTL